MRWPSSRTSGSGEATIVGDPLGPVGRGRILVEVTQVAADAGVHLGPLAAQQRLAGPAEHDAAGQVADDREAELGGEDQVLQRLADQFAQPVRRAAARSATAAGA